MLAVLEAAEKTLRPLARRLNLAWWESSVEATDENARRRAEAELAHSNALADRELFREVEAALGSDHDPTSARSLVLLHASMLPHQVPEALRARLVELQADVESRFSRHRAVVRGRELDENEIRRILRGSEDPDERREAWEGSKTVGAEVASDVRELARLRNEAARSLGHRDWFALSLATDELDEDHLWETLGACDRATAPPFARWKAALDARLAERFGCGTHELRPWHYADPFFQEPPPEGAVDLDPYFEGHDVVALAGGTFEGIGLDVSSVVARSDLYPRDGKNQHAFCIDIDREGDVRVLANVTDDHYSASTMLHELGHGAFDLGFDEELPWLLRNSHLVTTEAVALLFGGLCSEREWLERALGLDSREAQALDGRLRAARAADLLVFTRWVLVMTEFERALYADPDGDLDAKWWDLVARRQLLTPPDGRDAPDWAAKIHVAAAPVYYHTYLYGSIVALQIRDALVGAAGGIVEQPPAGALLRRKLFGGGQSVRWDALVEDVSGSPLRVDALEREVGAAVPAA